MTHEREKESLDRYGNAEDVQQRSGAEKKCFSVFIPAVWREMTGEENKARGVGTSLKLYNIRCDLLRYHSLRWISLNIERRWDLCERDLMDCLLQPAFSHFTVCCQNFSIQFTGGTDDWSIWGSPFFVLKSVLLTLSKQAWDNKTFFFSFSANGDGRMMVVQLWLGRYTQKSQE